ncbi:MAG: hypothetical protein V4691_03405 [Pseudomonadota bacterium]
MTLNLDFKAQNIGIPLTKILEKMVYGSAYPFTKRIDENYLTDSQMRYAAKKAREIDPNHNGEFTAQEAIDLISGLNDYHKSNIIKLQHRFYDNDAQKQVDLYFNDELLNFFINKLNELPEDTAVVNYSVDWIRPVAVK